MSRLTRQLERIMPGSVSAPVIIKAKADALPNIRKFLLLNFRLRGTLIRRFRMFSSILPIDVIDELKQLKWVEKIYLDRPMRIPEIKDLTEIQFDPIFRAALKVREFVARRAIRQPKPEWVPTSESRKLVEADIAQAEGYEGQGVKIAVVDTDGSFRLKQHRQLKGRTQTALAIPEPTDLNGHGGHVATTCAGSRLTTRTGLTVEGVAPKASVLGVKVLRGALGIGSTSTIIKGVELALKKGANIINLSLGGSPTENPEEDPLFPVFEEIKKKVVVVAAAGNDGPEFETMNSPGSLPNVVGVGAINPRTLNVTSFSSRGETPDGRRKPDIVAPGDKVFSGITLDTYLDYVSDYLGNGFSALSGTSMATPHVSGICALAHQLSMKQRGIPLTTETVLKICERFADHPKDNERGWGRIRWSWFKEALK